MSRGFELHLDYGAVGNVLRSSDVAAVMRHKAEEVAAIVRPSATETFVDDYVTDRAAASVTVIDWDEAHELKYGDLTDAAAAAGLEVHRG